MKLLLSRELGRLAKWLRILGFDAEYFQEDNLSSLIIRALRDERIVLTRNQRLAQTRGVKTVFIKNEKLTRQIPEALKALQVKLDSVMMFTRCTLCNLKLAPVEKDKVQDRVPDYVFKTQDNFFACPRCQRIYWQGTHWGNVRELLEDIGE